MVHTSQVVPFDLTFALRTTDLTFSDAVPDVLTFDVPAVLTFEER